jgi:hypothetical protein
VGEIFGQHPLGGADGVEVAREAGFGADCAGKLAGAHAVEEARRHAFALQEAERAAVGVRQHRLGAMGGDDRPQPRRDVGDGFVPCHRRKVAAAFRPDATQRCRQPAGVIGALQVAIHLAAELALRNWLLRVPPDVHSAPAAGLHGDLPATGVRAVVRARAGDDGIRGVVLIEVDLCHRLLAPDDDERFAAGIVPHHHRSV